MKTAIVTGTSGGIGRSLAMKLASEYKVILVARSREKLKRVQTDIEESGGQAEIIVADLTSNECRQKLYRQAKGKQIDLLINNAGVGGQARFTEQDKAKIQTIIDLNITALTEICRHFAPNMKSGQAVINIASAVSFFPAPSVAVYAASKAYVLSFSEALCEELKSNGVHVMALCPGLTKTGFDSAADMQRSAVYSMRNLPGPDEVADYALNALARKKVVAIHGTTNKIGIFFLRFIPSSLTRSIAKRMMTR
ncbi:SDR family oxidoreductase [Patescibacteria group bacterium]|nr:MAG: SDR family oxidoreductase [Patescibacteria group bacterium]